MLGGAVTGALSMAFGATLRAPHGGIFVVPLIGNPFLYLIAIAAGVCVTTALVVVLKGMRKPSQENTSGAAGGTAAATANAEGDDGTENGKDTKDSKDTKDGKDTEDGKDTKQSVTA
jgi:hypothetical protein